jgi:hypothetical protein
VSLVGEITLPCRKETLLTAREMDCVIIGSVFYGCGSIFTPWERQTRNFGNVGVNLSIGPDVVEVWSNSLNSCVSCFTKGTYNHTCACIACVELSIGPGH